MVNLLQMKLQRELREINEGRFQWVNDLYKESVVQREQWSHRKKEWDEKVDLILSDLTKRGYVKEADELAAHLLSNPRVTRPGRFTFEFDFPVPGGKETLAFGGYEDPGPGRDSDDDSDGEPDAESHGVSDGNSDGDSDGNGDSGCIVARKSGNESSVRPSSFDVTRSPALPPAHGEASRFLAQVEVVDVALRAAEMPLISWSQAKQHVHLNHEGVAFCFHCPCPNVPVPVLGINPSGPKYDLYPPYIHWGNAVAHFRTVHNESNLHFRMLLLKYGREGEFAAQPPGQ